MAKFQSRFYRVTHCGYYGRGDSEPSLAGLESTLEALKDWSQDLRLAETRMEGVGECLPSYLLDIARYGSCWTIVLWNEVPAEDGKVNSVLGTDRVGAADVHATTLQDGAIPGFATYAAFFPDVGIYVALKHGDVITGTKQLKNYISTYLHRSSPWVRVDVVNAEEPEILGYLEIDADDEEIRTDLAPRFGIQLVRTGEQRAKIIGNHAKVRKIIRVREIPTVTAPERVGFQRILQVLGLEGEPSAKSVRIRHEVPMRVSREQLRDLIDSVEEELEPRRNDIAVVYDKDPKPHWLSGSIPHLELDVSIDRDGAVFPAGRLARSLAARRNELLAEIER